MLSEFRIPIYQVCPGFRACSPTISEIIPLRTNNGIKEITNEMGCKCLPLPSGCKRLSSLRSFYRGTKYERVIDVGKCTGNCGNKSCQPLSIKTVAIKTPNGKQMLYFFICICFYLSF